MIVGFTGTREEITPDRVTWIEARLRTLRATRLHHGDCLGADTAAHEVARRLGIPIEIHPSTISRLRAYNTGAVKVHMPKPPLVRNRDIVDACDILLAVTRTEREELRSGTWATIRYARAVRVKVDWFFDEATELPASVTCSRCGMTSYNAHDVREGYCGNCHDWTAARSSRASQTLVGGRRVGVDRPGGGV